MNNQKNEKKFFNPLKTVIKETIYV